MEARLFWESALTLDEQLTRARELGTKAAASGLSDLDNPYTSSAPRLYEAWASGYSGYTGALQVLRVETERLAA
jgi:hypothetical protein